MKKGVVIFGTLLAIACLFLAGFFIIFYPFKGLTGGTNYQKALSECEKLYEKRKEDFHSAQELLLKSESTDSVKVYGVESIARLKGTDGHTIVIEFTTGNQGLMTGGQDWGVYYTSSNQPEDLSGYKEKEDFSKGPYMGSYYYSNTEHHLFYATEKIDDYWYFYYIDYDGNHHGLDWQQTE